MRALYAEQAAYDKARSVHLEALGYRVVRFWNNEVSTNPDGVVQRLQAFLHRGEEPSP